MSAEGTARAVKPWFSFQCTGIHHAVQARTYKGDEHLAYALNKSMAPLPLPFVQGRNFMPRGPGARRGRRPFTW